MLRNSTLIDVVVGVVKTERHQPDSQADDHCTPFANILVLRMLLFQGFTRHGPQLGTLADGILVLQNTKHRPAEHMLGPFIASCQRIRQFEHKQHITNQMLKDSGVQECNPKLVHVQSVWSGTPSNLLVSSGCTLFYSMVAP